MAAELRAFAGDSDTFRPRYPTLKSPELRHILIEPPAPAVPIPALYGLTETDDAWRWRDREILRLEALLIEHRDGAGGTASVSDQTDSGPLATLLHADGGVDADGLRSLFTAMVTTEGLLDAVRQLDVAGRLSSLIEHAHRQQGLQQLVDAVNNPASSRDDLRAVVGQESWVFGGRYLPPYALESVYDQVPRLRDISLALVRTDGAIHIVDVNEANIDDLIVRVDGDDSTRRSYSVGARIQNAVNRVINQLRLLDEVTQVIEATLRVETRRALATVLIGHRSYLDDLDASELRTTSRTYSSHLSGIEVISYDELIRTGERALALDEPRAELPATGP